MGDPLSKTVSRTYFTWQPHRAPLRWAESAEDIPPWDMSRGFAIANQAGHRHARTPFENLEEQPFEGSVEERRLLSLAWSNFYTSTPTATIDYPRLVRRYPGPSEKDAIWENSPKKRFYKKVIALSKLLSLSKRSKLKEEILGLANDYSLLTLSRGDSLSDWMLTIYCYKYLISLIPKIKDIIDYGGSKIDKNKPQSMQSIVSECKLDLRNDFKSSGFNCLPWENIFDELNSVIYSAVNHSSALNDLNYYLGHFISTNSRFAPEMSLAVGTRFGGLGLVTGAQAWGFFEILHDFEKLRKACEVCGVLLTGREDAKVCASSRCQKRQYRKKLKERELKSKRLNQR